MAVTVWEGFLEELVLGWILEVSWKERAFWAGGGRWGFPLLSGDAARVTAPLFTGDVLLRRAPESKLDPDSTGVSGC